VGRAALDEDAIRLIEELNPGMAFDWPRILKGQGTPSIEPRPPAEDRRQRPESRRQRPPTSKPAPASTVALAESPVAEPSLAAEAPSTAPASEPAEPAEFGEQPTEAPVESDVVIAAHARLGAEGVRRLRARHAEILARIAEKTADPLRQQELKAQANRLNPDAWATDEDVVQGLEQYEYVLASLKEVASQRRRRRRRGRGPGSEPGDPQGAAVADAPAGAHDVEPSDSTGGDEGDSAPE
jgi:hypothetical protein